GAGNEQGLHLRGASGTVTDIIGTEHNGGGPALHIEMVESNLEILGAELSGGDNSPAISVEWSDMFIISNSVIHGSPGIIVDHSSLSINSVDFIGDGNGVAIDIIGARSETSHIQDCDFDDYENSIHLVGEEGDDEMPHPIFTGNHHHASVAYASERLAFISYGETIEGAIELFGSKAVTAEIWDPISFDSSQINVSGAASLVLGSVWDITVLGEGSSVLTQAIVEVTIPSFGDVISEQTINADTTQGSASIPFIYHSWTELGSSAVSSAIWRANAPSYMEGEGSFVPTQFSSRNITSQLIKNQAPFVNITLPEQGIEVQEGESTEFNAVGQDPDSLINDLSYVWYLRAQGENAPGNEIFTGSNGVVDNIGPVGVYIVTVKVTDSWGSSAEDMVTINVILNDADNDYIETCVISGPNAWYDLEENRACGPDVYDDDDDNDMIPDDRDIYPNDPCAHSDFDMDGLPNSLIPDCETQLIEDDDDDNDGVLDNVDPNPLDPAISGLDGDDSNLGFLSPSIILPIVLLVVVIVFIFLRGSRNEFGGEEFS
ncbi:MAG: hypothetical protein CMA77_04100, partial [Euryarchaeota archaeon]|nr:hypothetical protein [Euryarchaeota archaeon]